MSKLSLVVRRGLSPFLIAVAAIWITLLMWKAFRAFNVAGEKNLPSVISGWRSLIIDRKVVSGKQGSDFVIVEFSDYQCPFCRNSESDVENFMMQHSEDAAFYRLNLPLDSFTLTLTPLLLRPNAPQTKE